MNQPTSTDQTPGADLLTADLSRILHAHRQHTSPNFPAPGICVSRCHSAWPCEAHRAASALAGLMAEHTNEPVYLSAELCEHPEPVEVRDNPHDSTWDDWADEHPPGTADVGRVCSLAETGRHCPACTLLAYDSEAIGDDYVQAGQCIVRPVIAHAMTRTAAEPSFIGGLPEDRVTVNDQHEIVPVHGFPEAVDVWYHGTSGGHTVAVEDQDGTVLGLLPHIEHAAHSCHSPTGYSWGYPGSGPAELARMLLIDALGDAAQCPVCGGCQQIIWPLDDAAAPVPFDTSISDLCDPDSVMRCDACDDGYRRLPYQDFKDQYVAGWSDGWQMSRSGIRAWLTRRGEIAAEQAGR